MSYVCVRSKDATHIVNQSWFHNNQKWHRTRFNSWACMQDNHILKHHDTISRRYKYSRLHGITFSFTSKLSNWLINSKRHHSYYPHTAIKYFQSLIGFQPLLLSSHMPCDGSVIVAWSTFRKETHRSEAFTLFICLGEFCRNGIGKRSSHWVQFASHQAVALLVNTPAKRLCTLSSSWAWVVEDAKHGGVCHLRHKGAALL